MSLRGRLPRGWLLGTFAAGVLFAWLVTAGRADLFEWQPSGDFYDAQAHAFLDGRLDVPFEVPGVEAFVVDGKAYLYFGPVPALLRVPVAALTDGLDGRLTQVSMLVAFWVAMLAAGRLSRQIRALVRPGSQAGRWVEAGAAFALGAGSTVLYLAGKAFVYHEALLWGVAFSLVSYSELLAVQTDESRRTRHVALATVAATLAFLTRASVGAGPVAALGLLALLALRRRRGWLALGAATAAPLLLYMAVNVAKFDRLVSVPFEKQVISALDAHRQEFLAENDGTLFGLRFAPTTALAYARPDGVATQRPFPWVTYPALARPVGDVPFDYVDRAASATATMPALVVLSAVGLVAVVRRRSPLAPLRPLVIGAAAGAATTLTIAFIAHRYLADAIPVFVLLGLAGLHSLRSRRVLAGVAVLGLLGVAANLALGLQYQRLFGPALEEGTRAAFVGVQAALPGRGALAVEQGPSLPAAGEQGDLYAVGDCDALYWHDGDVWQPLERTAAAGRLRLRVTVPEGRAGARVPLGTAGSVPVELELEDGDRARLVIAGTPGFRTSELGSDRTVEVDVAVDDELGRTSALVDRVAVFNGGPERGAGPARATRGVEVLPTPTDLCQRLAGGSSS